VFIGGVRSRCSEPVFVAGVRVVEFGTYSVLPVGFGEGMEGR